MTDHEKCRLISEAVNSGEIIFDANGRIDRISQDSAIRELLREITQAEIEGWYYRMTLEARLARSLDVH